MVKRNSKLLGKTVLDEENSSDVERDPRFWQDVLDLYFFRGKESRRRQDDDLVFLVRKLVRNLWFHLLHFALLVSFLPFVCLCVCVSVSVSFIGNV